MVAALAAIANIAMAAMIRVRSLIRLLLDLCGGRSDESSWMTSVLDLLIFYSHFLPRRSCAHDYEGSSPRCGIQHSDGSNSARTAEEHRRAGNQGEANNQTVPCAAGRGVGILAEAEPGPRVVVRRSPLQRQVGRHQSRGYSARL